MSGSSRLALGPLQLLWEPLMRKRRIVSITSLTGCHPRLGKKLFYNPGLAGTNPPIKAALESALSPKPHPHAQPHEGRMCYFNNCCYFQE